MINEKRILFSTFLLVIQSLSIALLLLALSDHPYTYYRILRWVVFLTATLTTIKLFKANYPKWLFSIAFIFIGIAVLFNPFFPIYFKRDIWQILDILSAAVFMATIIILRVLVIRFGNASKD